MCAHWRRPWRTPELPVLRTLKARGLKSVTALGIRALASAFIKNCPHVMLMDFINFSYKKDDLRDEMAEMVRTAGCQHRLTINI